MGWLEDWLEKILMGSPKTTPPEPRLSEEEEKVLTEEFLANKDRWYYCKCCGKITIVPCNIRNYYDRYCKTDGDKIIHPVCNHCGSLNSFMYSKYDIDYYWTRSKEVFGDSSHMDTILFEEEIETNPDFDREKFKIHCDEKARIKASIARRNLEAYMKLNADTTPRCPTCSSSSIERISTTKKVVGAATLGYYSKNAMCQFVCKNCGYKW